LRYQFAVAASLHPERREDYLWQPIEFAVCSQPRSAKLEIFLIKIVLYSIENLPLVLAE
jgi:hypothetical protein